MNAATTVNAAAMNEAGTGAATNTDAGTAAATNATTTVNATAAVLPAAVEALGVHDVVAAVEALEVHRMLVLLLPQMLACCYECCYYC